MRNIKRLTLTLCLLFIIAPFAGAQERLCDTAFEDCRQPLWDLIDHETAGIDVSFWFIQDTSLSNKLIARWQSGVPVRILCDPRASSDYSGNQAILDQLKAAGIPMRYKLQDGIQHMKFMIFIGQNKLEFSGANYGPFFFVPNKPYVDYIDEAIYFTDDVSIINSFKTKMDDMWTDTVAYGNYGNITGPLARNYATTPISPDLNFPPSADGSQDFYNRTSQEMNRETQKIDIIMYRLTNDRYTNTTISAVERGVPVRLLTEQNEYRNPSRPWDAYNVDLLYNAGVQIRIRAHQGLNHEKVVMLYSKGETIFGSSNWTGPSSNSQAENNYFTTKPWFFQWFVNHFERKWNSTTETQPFVPLPPDAPQYQTPASNATVQGTTNVQLVWEGGPYAHKFDIYFGTNPNPPLYAADQFIGSVDNTVPETFTLPTLQPGTKYYWKIVSKTMANMTASGPVNSFTTAQVLGAPPTINNITPNSGVSNGGTTVTINGTNFASGATVKIGGVAATNVTVTSATTMTAMVPSHAAGTADVVVTNTDTQSATLAGGFTYTVPPPPPPGTLLTDDFSSASIDTTKWSASNLFSGFSDTTVPVNQANQSLNIGPLPQGQAASGSHYIGVSSINSYNFSGAYAQVEMVRPAASNTAADAMLTIGHDSNNYYRIYVEAGNLIVQKRLGGTKMTLLTIPYDSVNHRFLRIRHDFGTGNVFFETAPGNAGVPGTWASLASEVWNTSSVPLGGVLFELKAGTWQAEANAPGTVSFDNFKAAVPGSSSPAPTVGGITPNTGATTGATSVTISGTGFSSGAVVVFGGLTATNVVVTSSTTITASTPAHQAGAVNVVVTNSDGQSGTLAGGFTYQVPATPPPTVSNISPAGGSTTGGTAVTISGSGFQSGATITLGGVAATNVVVSNSTTITAVTPAHAAGPVDVVITNPDTQRVTLAGGFTYAQALQTALLVDDFSGGALDQSKWQAGNLFSGFTDVGLPVAVASQRLEIGPLPQQTSGSHYNGVISHLRYDFTGAYAYVAVVQAPAVNTTADAMFTLGQDANNYYRIYEEAGTIFVQKRLAGGAKVTMWSAPYDAAAHLYWRIRHDAASGSVVFETAPDGGGAPGAWVVRYSEAWNTAGVPLGSVLFELKGGTWQAEANAPGKVAFDNFAAIKP